MSYQRVSRFHGRGREFESRRPRYIPKICRSRRALVALVDLPCFAFAIRTRMPRLKGSADLLEDRRKRALALLDSG